VEKREAVKYLVGTSALIHSLVSKSKLNHIARDLLRDPASGLYLPAVSSWELWIKLAIGELILHEKPRYL
jgi:PIN domain nuclease of toxin-antitoxin system